MTILNDKEIRSLCLVPSHKLVPHSGDPMKLLAHIAGDRYYDLKTGREDHVLPIDGALTPIDLDTTLSLNPRMITPFEPGQVKQRIIHETNDETFYQKIISYGTSSMGYDVRLGNKFKIFTNVYNALIDPLNMPETAYVDHEGDFVIIPPHSYILGHTIEYFKIPKDILTICVGKSTYARVGCAVNVTPIEPGFEGNVVIEIANQTPLPMKVYANMGIAQFLFLKGNPCEVSYGDRSGKYQGQTGIQTALV